MEQNKRRKSGQVIVESREIKWLVLSESSEDEKGWRHRCGTKIIGQQILWTPIRMAEFPKELFLPFANPYEVPYCPECELFPHYKALDKYFGLQEKLRREKEVGEVE